jgi:hypothetical protein
MSKDDKGLNADQKKALFEAYEQAKQKVGAASLKLDATVRAIADACGAGPFRWNGQDLRIRKSRVGERLVMSALKTGDVEEIG